jgi:hypothetical protein
MVRTVGNKSKLPLLSFPFLPINTGERGTTWNMATKPDDLVFLLSITNARLAIRSLQSRRNIMLSCTRKHSRQQTMEVNEMVFAHIASLLVDVLRGQVVVGCRQGETFSAGAAGKGFRMA